MLNLVKSITKKYLLNLILCLVLFVPHIQVYAKPTKEEKQQALIQKLYEADIYTNKETGEYNLALNEQRANEIIPVEVTNKHLLTIFKDGAKGMFLLNGESLSLASDHYWASRSKPFHTGLRYTVNHGTNKTQNRVKDKGSPNIKKEELAQISPFTGSYEGTVNTLMIALKKVYDNQAVQLLFKIINDSQKLGISLFSIFTSVVAVVIFALTVSACTPFTAELLIVSAVLTVVFLIPSLLINMVEISLAISKFIIKNTVIYLNNLRRRRLILKHKYTIMKDLCYRDLESLKSYEQQLREWKPNCEISVDLSARDNCHYLRLSNIEGGASTLKLTSDMAKILSKNIHGHKLNLHAKDKTLKLLNQRLNQDDVAVETREAIAFCMAENTMPTLEISGFPLLVLSSRASYFSPNLKHITFRDEGDQKAFKLVMAALHAPDVKIKKNPTGHDFLDFLFLQDHGNPINLASNMSMPYTSLSDCKQKVRKELKSMERPVGEMVKELLDQIGSKLGKLSPKLSIDSDKWAAKWGQLTSSVLSSINKIDTILEHKEGDDVSLDAKISSLYDSLPSTVKDHMSLEKFKSTFFNPEMIEAIAVVFGVANKNVGERCSRAARYDAEEFSGPTDINLDERSAFICEQNYEPYVHCIESIHETFRKIHQRGQALSREYKQDFSILKLVKSESRQIIH